MHPRLLEYLKEQAACCKPSTVVIYQGVLRTLYEDLELSNIAALTREDLRGYVLRLCERPLVPYTKVNYLLAVRKYLAWEVQRGHLGEELLDVLDRKSLPQVPEYLPRPLSQETDCWLQERLKRSDSPYAPLFLLLRHTGMRISELIHLPKDCVLTTAKGEKYLKVPLGKMNNERLVPLSGDALGWIETIEKKPLKTRRRDPGRLIGLGGPTASVYSHLTQRFRKTVGDRTDGNKPITFHRLRHTYATTLLSGGVSLVSLMKLLGHRRIEMTLRYAKVTPDHLRNEYLKAIGVLENRSRLVRARPISRPVADYEPSELLACLTTFVGNASRLKSNHRKNLLKKLRRLTVELSRIRFSQKFKLPVP